VSEKRNAVKVTIIGDEYTLRSDESPERTRAVAEYLDTVIRSILSAHSRIETNKAAILAALQITDELLRERQTARGLDESIRSLSAEVRRWLPPGKRGEDSEASSG
jgi:cell division protein ZapA